MTSETSSGERHMDALPLDRRHTIIGVTGVQPFVLEWCEVVRMVAQGATVLTDESRIAVRPI